MGNIVIMDKEERIHSSLSSVLKPMGHSVEARFQPEDTMEVMRDGNIQLAILEAESGGLDLVDRIKKEELSVDVILTVASAEKILAMNALRQGAIDILLKPLSVKEFVHRISESVVQEGNPSIAAQNKEEEEFVFIMPLYGSSQKARSLQRTFEDFKKEKSRLPVLIHGRHGAYKHEFARILHGISGDPKAGMRTFDCREMDTSTLHRDFISEDGTLGRFFDGITSETIIIDNVDCLSETDQDRLSKAMDEVLRTAFVIFIVDVDVDELLHEEAFGMSLYFRISARNFLFDPLDKRIEDVEEMAKGLLAYSSLIPDDCRSAELSPEVLAILKAYDWPDNYKELEAVLTVSAIEARGNRIQPNGLKRKMGRQNA
jgi:DNA-binding NtrC family response regulator